MKFELSLVERIQNSLDYVELHINEEIRLEDLAKHAYMSLSSYYNLFSKLFDTTIKNYITKRRLSISAYKLINTDKTILMIALEAMYSSYEAYSRKFKKIFGVSPSLYRKNGLYIEIFPKVNLINDRVIYSDGGMIMNVTKGMNSEMLIKKMSHQIEGYLMDVDIDCFKSINDNYGYEVGDKVLLEVPKRIEKTLKDMNVPGSVIRINGDEYAVILKNLKKEEVGGIAQNMIDSMIPVFDFGEIKLSVSISIGIAKFNADNNDAETKQGALDALYKSKIDGKNTYNFY